MCRSKAKYWWEDWEEGHADGKHSHDIPSLTFWGNARYDHKFDETPDCAKRLIFFRSWKAQVYIYIFTYTCFLQCFVHLVWCLLVELFFTQQTERDIHFSWQAVNDVCTIALVTHELFQRCAGVSRVCCPICCPNLYRWIVFSPCISICPLSHKWFEGIWCFKNGSVGPRVIYIYI